VYTSTLRKEMFLVTSEDGFEHATSANGNQLSPIS